MDKNTIEYAYKELRMVTLQVANAHRRVNGAKIDLERAKFIVIVAGKIEGKNVEQRNAHMGLLLHKKIGRLQEYEMELQAVRSRYDLISIKVKEVNLLTQLYIANAKVKGDI